MSIAIATSTPNELIDNLPDIEIAELKAKIAKTRIENFLEKIKSISSDMGIMDCVGIFLLHRHHHDSGKKVLIREYTTDSMSVSLSEMDNTLVPAAWMVLYDDADEALFAPVEWSKDELSREQFQRLKDADFFEIFGKELKAAGLEDLLGLTLSWANVMSVGSKEILVEQTELEGNDVFKANVVRPEEASEFKDDDLVETNWFFGVNKSCRCARGATYCASWATFCVRRSPGHSVVERCTRRRVEHTRQCTG